MGITYIKLGNSCGELKHWRSQKSFSLYALDIEKKRLQKLHSGIKILVSEVLTSNVTDCYYINIYFDDESDEAAFILGES